jgi:hypothetical protein
MMGKSPGFWMAAALLGVAAPAAAEPTDIVVRVLSQGAKFIGSGMGGAEIIIRDVESGAILAQGVTSGGTGDTRAIMQQASRDAPRAGPGAAAFRARIDVAEPRLVAVSARGPLAQPQAAVVARDQRWLIPGAPVAGDGWVLELPGLAVRIVQPSTPAHPAAGSTAAKVMVHVSMLCGCPIEPGGLWDAARFEIKARIDHDGRGMPATSLAYAGSTGDFSAELPLDGPGNYLVTVTAFDRQTGAAGIDRASIEAR